MRSSERLYCKLWTAPTSTDKLENDCSHRRRKGYLTSLQRVGPVKNSMTEFRFFDTNILLYLYDRRDERKRRRAAEIFRDCWETKTLVISTQVIQEFYAAGTRKLGLDSARAHGLLVDLCHLRVVSIGCAQILRATEIERRFAVSFWDALILSAAHTAGASIVYSEDLQHGQDYDGVRVQNPFQHSIQ